MKKVVFVFWMLWAFLGKGQEARLVLPVGHTGVISAAIFSPNNKLACTISDKDETPIVWDVESGKMLYQLIGHEAPVNFVTFSPSGAMIYTQSAENVVAGESPDNTVRIWETKTGKEIRKFKSVTREIHFKNNLIGSQVFSPDEKFIIVPNKDSTHVWELSTSKVFQSFQRSHTAILANTVSGDSKIQLLALTSDISKNDKEHTATIWNVLDGKPIQVLTGHNHKIEAATFSPNYKFVLTVSYDKTLKVWDVQNGKLLYNLVHNGYITSAEFSSDCKYIVSSALDGFVRVMDLNTYKIIHKFKKPDNNSVIYSRISKNAKYLATANDKNIIVYDLEKGTVLLNFVDSTNRNFTSIEFSSDDNYLITGSYDPNVRIWDLKNKKQKHILRGKIEGFYFSNISTDGTKSVSYGTKSYLNQFYSPSLWNLKTGKILHELKTGGALHPIKFSVDNKYLVGCSYYVTEIWDVETGKLIKFPHESKYLDENWVKGTCDDAIFSSDNNYLITVGLQRQTLNTNNKTFGYNATVWDINIGKKLRILNQHDGPISSVDLSRDGKYVLTASSDGFLKISEFSTGNEIKTIDATSDKDSKKVAKFSPDASRVLILQQYTFEKKFVDAEVWSVDKGEQIYELKGHVGNVNFAEFSIDGKYILTASEDNTAKIWDANNGKELLTFKGHEGSVNTANFSSDGKYVLTTGNDNKSILWNAKTGKIIYHHLQFKDGEWLAYDENYRYDGSEKARNLLYFVCGLEIVDLFQVKDALYVPNLVQRLMNGENLDHLPKLNDLEICGLTPEIEPIKNKNDGNYYSEISPGKGGTGQVEIYINGMLRQTVDSKTLTQKDGIFELKIDEKLIQQYQIADKETEIKVIARTADNKISSRGSVAKATVKESVIRKPQMHAIMVGIDDYKGSGLDLNYAAKDAIDLQTALKISTQKLFNVDDTNRVHFYNLTLDRSGNINGLTPDRNNVLKTLEKIEKESKPEDVFVLFFAGHGEINPEKQLILLTAEASKDQAPNYSGILMKELLEKLARIPAGKRILLLDACHSGAAINELNIKDIAGVRDGEDAEKQSQRLKELENLASKSGLAIITASSTDQKALELPQYEHGLMTYALLTTMLNDPEVLDKDNNLQLEDWLRQTEKNVSKLIENQSAQRFVPVNFSVGKVDEAVRKCIVLQEIPTVVVANVYNKELDDDNLDLKTKLIKKLNEISTRGGTDKILIAKEDGPNAISVNLSYELSEGKIKSKITLKKEKKVFKQFNFEGNAADLNKFVEELSKEITKNLK